MIDETLILFSTQAEVMRYRKRLVAASSNASLGVKVTTPEALVEELWEVWGSGESLVSTAQRKMIIKMVLAEQDSWVASAGTVDLLAPFVRDLITYLDEDFCAEHQHEFSPTDEGIIRFIRRYNEALAQAGLIEGAQALECIASAVTLPCVTVRIQQTLPAFFRSFLEQVAESVQDASPQLEPLLSVDEPEYLLLKPAGSSVAPLMAFEAILEGGQDQKVLVTAPDPEALFESMKDSLIEQGYCVSLEATRSFRSSFFGRAYDALALILDHERPPSQAAVLAAAITYVRSPYAQLPVNMQADLERRLRADRTLTREDIASLLAQASRSFEFFEELLEESDAEVLFSFFEELACRVFPDEAERKSELALLAQAKALYQDARACGIDPGVFFDQMLALSAPYSVSFAPASEDAPEYRKDIEAHAFEQVQEDESAWVLFTAFDAAARYPAGMVDTVIMTALDDAHYACSEHHSTLSEFLEHFKLPYCETVRKEAQDRFVWNRTLARRRVVFEYAQHDLDGKDCYPAFFLEEFLSLKKQEGEGVVSRSCGETAFDRAIRLLPVEEERVWYERPACRGVLTDEERAQLLNHHHDKEGRERIVLSPSALETYRKCPYRWFVDRKLRLEEGGEEFGPLEIGSFVHQAFQTFYDRWADAGNARVTPDTRDQALSCLGEVFDQLVAEQAALEPGDRLVAINELERGQIAKLRSQLLESLSMQADIFPSYHVEGHELVIAPEEQIVYGGAIIQGRIDRIDVDDQGNYVVIDYKGSLKGHEAAFEGFDDLESFTAPEKIQALVYAQALRRRNPALHPKGALYLSYRAKRPSELMRGALVETMPECGVFTSKSSTIEGNFESYLDLVEQDLEQTIACLERGEIAPDPKTKNACDHCPALYCEKRINGS